MTKFNPWLQKIQERPTVKVELKSPDGDSVYSVTLLKLKASDQLEIQSMTLEYTAKYLPKSEWPAGLKSQTEPVDFPPIRGELVAPKLKDIQAACLVYVSQADDEKYTVEELVAISFTWPEFFDALYAECQSLSLFGGDDDPKSQTGSQPLSPAPTTEQPVIPSSSSTSAAS